MLPDPIGRANFSAMRYPTDTNSQRGSALERFSKPPSMQEEITRAKLDFHDKFQKTIAYQMLSPMNRYQQGRLERLEEACWRFRSAAARKELMGARAERILVHLERLGEELREAIWLPEHVPPALDTLRDSLEFLASRKRQGRPRDSLGQTFRRNMWIFFSPGVLLKDGWRSLSRLEIDEVLNDLFTVAIGRTLSFESFVRMRKREQAEERKDLSASRRRRAVSLEKNATNQ